MMADLKITEPDELYEKESIENWKTLSMSHNLVQMHIDEDPKRIVVKSFVLFSMGKQRIVDFLINSATMGYIFEGYREIQESPAVIASLELPTPLGMSKRKIVVEIKKSQTEKKSSLIYVNSDYREPNDNGIRRSQVNYMGFIIEEVSEHLTKFWFLCDIDPAGTLSNSVVEYMKKYLAMVPRKIKDRIKNKPQ